MKHLDAIKEAEIFAKKNEGAVCIIKNGIDDFKWKEESKVSEKEKQNVIQTFSIEHIQEAISLDKKAKEKVIKKKGK